MTAADVDENLLVALAVTRCRLTDDHEGIRAVTAEADVVLLAWNVASIARTVLAETDDPVLAIDLTFAALGFPRRTHPHEGA